MCFTLTTDVVQIDENCYNSSSPFPIPHSLFPILYPQAP
ncbi:hypothetical protein GXM_00756 [Nostoc sphaeroides CCNUC1]|uniref:Uncharacterized protein n=1 Tax=Nostoc sphaeroides CCNUC1 TaxID=2653204 RepID=A0A5P8VS62_9NOSO|nr:hypothetical protein GXM_00756 [Nostoc sphaeroides CCNUC1]